jgi:hypothetical protein
MAGVQSIANLAGRNLSIQMMLHFTPESQASLSRATRSLNEAIG